METTNKSPKTTLEAFDIKFVESGRLCCGTHTQGGSYHTLSSNFAVVVFFGFANKLMTLIAVAPLFLLTCTRPSRLIVALNKNLWPTSCKCICDDDKSTHKPKHCVRVRVCVGFVVMPLHFGCRCVVTNNSGQPKKWGTDGTLHVPCSLCGVCRLHALLLLAALGLVSGEF